MCLLAGSPLLATVRQRLVGIQKEYDNLDTVRAVVLTSSAPFVPLLSLCFGRVALAYAMRGSLPIQCVVLGQCLKAWRVSWS